MGKLGLTAQGIRLGVGCWLLLVAADGRAQCPPDCPFDLVTAGFDSNGLPMNPQWRHQTTTGHEPSPGLCGKFPDGFPSGKPQCTSDAVSTDGPRGIKNLICNFTGGDNFKGHINWWPVTFGAKVQWTEIAVDGDFNWDLDVPDHHIITTELGTLHTEAAGRESVNRFKTAWWKRFRNASVPEKKRMIDGQPAVISGLLNLDAEHGAYSELHPIYALAILSDRRAEPQGSNWRDTWQIFLRNWGNEGFCSSKQHVLRKLTPAACARPTGCVWLGIDLPIGGNDAVSIDTAHTKLHVRGVVGSPQLVRTSAGATVRFILEDIPKTVTDPRQWPQVHGEIQLVWHPAAGIPALRAAAVANQAEKAEREVGGLDALLDLLVDSASPSRRTHLQAMEASGPKVDFTALAMDTEKLSRPAPLTAAETAARPVAEALDVGEPDESEQQLETICDGARRVSADPEKRVRAQALGMDPRRLAELVESCREEHYIR
ncbi:MAG TPA: hypothetical protein VI172_13275 [Candidatus Dormibacteraeota bacterium]